MNERAPHTLAVAFPTAHLRPLDGHVEVRVAEAISAGLPRTDQVTEIVSALFDRIGGEVTSRALVRRLATGARAWLLMKAARVFHNDQAWFSARCSCCAEPYDIEVDLAAVPRSEPMAGYPIVEIETSLGARRFEIPNGSVEAALARAAPDNARVILAALSGLAVTSESDAAKFTDADLTAIEAALDQATPDLAEEVTSICPACNNTTNARLDPLNFAFPAPDQLDRDIYLIARTYGWDEPTILALPTVRRRRHAAMIARELRGSAR